MSLTWAPLAFAKLIHLFARGFEGDRVLERKSFVERLSEPTVPPLDLAFRLGALRAIQV